MAPWNAPSPLSLPLTLYYGLAALSVAIVPASGSYPKREVGR